MATRSIGRHPDCDIVVKDPTVSRHHAELSQVGTDLFMIVDQDSTSGSFRWDGGEWKRFTNTRLRGGDRIRFGAFETTVSDLIKSASTSPAPSSPPKIERDPLTGQIVMRSR